MADPTDFRQNRWKILCDYAYTADEEQTFFAKPAIFCSDGKIDWIGPEADIPSDLRQADYPTCHAEGLIAMPGLINGHGHSNLNGYRTISDAANFTVWTSDLAPFTSTLTLEDIKQNNDMSILDMLHTGTTCVCDCTRYGAGLIADSCARFGMRCLAGGLANSPEYRNNGTLNFPQIAEDAKRYQEKYAADSRMAFFVGAHATYSCTGEMIQNAYKKSQDLGSRFVIHVAETITEENTILARTGLRPIAWLNQLGVLTPQTALIHCVQLDDTDIAMIRDGGCGVVHCPVSNAKLGNGISPVKKLLRQGVRVGLGTDSMLSNNSLDLFREMKMAALVSRLLGEEQALTNEEIVAMATRRGAEVLGLPDIGSLCAEKQADILLVKAWTPLQYNRERFLSDVVFYLDGSAVQSVFVGGYPVCVQGVLTQVDELAVKQEIINHYRRKTT